MVREQDKESEGTPATLEACLAPAKDLPGYDIDRWPARDEPHVRAVFGLGK